ncbi:hypothetical protein ACLB2K_006557 [Fragaria x ananassa]
MDHTNYLNNQLGNNLVSAAGDHVRMEDPIQLHHHHHQHQISYDSVWPNFPLQLHHQVPSSSSTHLHYDQFGHHDHDHHHHQLILPGNYNNFMDQEDIHHEEEPGEEEEELGAMKEMMYKIAAMQPVDIDPATIRKPKRRNVRISDDPQSVAARHRRERISEKIRILQRLVPGGTKMDTASMLEEAIRYVKFLKRQIRLLQQSSHHHHPPQPCINVNNTGVLLSRIPSASNAAALAGGGGTALDWLQPPPIHPCSAATSSSTETPTTRAALGFTAFGVSRGDVAALSFNHEVLIMSISVTKKLKSASKGYYILMASSLRIEGQSCGLLKRLLRYC